VVVLLSRHLSRENGPQTIELLLQDSFEIGSEKLHFLSFLKDAWIGEVDQKLVTAKAIRRIQASGVISGLEEATEMLTHLLRETEDLEASLSSHRLSKHVMLKGVGEVVDTLVEF
jgi:hypothetical protein